MKKLGVLVLGFTMAVSMLGGCSGGGGSDTTTAVAAQSSGGESKSGEIAAGNTAEKTEGKKVVYIADGLEDKFCNWMVSCLEAEIAANYTDFNLQVLDGQLNNDVQAQQLENAISMGVDCILFQNLDQYVCSPIVKQAQEAGITVINVQSPMYDTDGSIIAPYVDCDMYEVGKMVASYALDLIPENSQAVVLKGPASNIHSQMRYKGWMDILASRPDIKVVDEQIGAWMNDEGMRITEDWLQQYPEMNVVIALNDNMALGALEAAKAADRKILAFGVDGMADACASVKSEELTATALQDARALAAAACDLAKRAMAGEKLTGEDGIHAKAALITKENADEFIAIHAATK